MARIAKYTKKSPVMMAEIRLRIIQIFISSSSLTNFESSERIKKELEEPGYSNDNTHNSPDVSASLEIEEETAFLHVTHSKLEKNFN
jgi:hypothetical protein